MLAGSVASALVLTLPSGSILATDDTAIDRTKRLSSLYVHLRDGTRIAVDVWLPQDLGARRVGTVLQPTRYTRSRQSTSTRLEDDENYPLAEIINRAGFAFVIADGRGTGASFGMRKGELSDTEVQDFGEIIDWIAAQDFSNARVGAMGASYDGVLSEHLARLERPALKAIAPRFNYYGVYDDLCVPGGLYMRAFMTGWAVAVGTADRVPDILCREAVKAGKQSCEAYASSLDQPRPVDGPRGPMLLRAAQAEHARNISFPLTVQERELYFKDDHNDVVSWRNMSPEGHFAALAASAVPYYVQSSWLDRGSAGGTLRRFERLPNAQTVEIGPWSHGNGGFISDTMAGEHGIRSRSLAEQLQPIMAFFAEHLGENGQSRPGGKRLRYYMMGEATWHETRTWPPREARILQLHLCGDAALADNAPARSETVQIAIRKDHGTGRTGRWGAAWKGGPILFDREAQTRGLTCFRTQPLDADLRMAGHVRCSFHVVSNQSDAALFAYLDAISPTNAVHYLSEGALRLIHRSIAAPDDRKLSITPRSFARRDALPIVAGQPFRLQFEMQPIAARVAKGWRLQLSFADRDIDNFDHYGESQAPILALRISPSNGSWIELPIMPEGARDQ